MKLLKLKMDLQMFADGDGGSDGDGGQGADANTDSNTQNQSGSDTTDADKSQDGADKPFKAFASEQEWQSSVDKLIQTAIKTHDEKRANEDQQQKDYDKMTDLEKATYDRDQLTQQLADAQRHGTIVENKAKLTERLGTDDLPTTLIAAFSDDVLANDEGIEKAYTNISKAFTDSLQKAINKRIAASGTTVPGGTDSVIKSGGASAADSLNKEQQSGKSSLWATK